ncbi:uncharacterized protein V1518DRAFT_55245 [Limtongia smithiae]|uniref:uncharacterized protein n=1 Tax=Limtongia smithiae TaxID=1125753 RepID=UPI0034CFCE41
MSSWPNGTCPWPLTPWVPLPGTRFDDFYYINRRCVDGCCIPCGYLINDYPTLRKLIVSFAVVACVSFMIGFVLGISQILSQRLVKSEFNLLQTLGLCATTSSLTFFLIDRHDHSCKDSITPVLGRANAACMLQGLLYVFGYVLVSLGILVRTLNIHLIVVWHKRVPKYYFIGAAVFGASVFTAAGAYWVQFLLDLVCLPRPPFILYVVFIPILTCTLTAIIIEFFTTVFIIRTLFRVERDLYTTHNDLTLPLSYPRKAVVCVRCFRKYASLTWRTLVYTQFSALVITFFAITYFAFLGRNAATNYAAGQYEFLYCLQDSSSEYCWDKYKNALSRITFVRWSEVILWFTIILFITEFRPLLIQGWAAMIRHPSTFFSSKKREAVLAEIDEFDMSRLSPMHLFRRGHDGEDSDVTARHTPRRRRRREGKQQCQFTGRTWRRRARDARSTGNDEGEELDNVSSQNTAEGSSSTAVTTVSQEEHEDHIEFEEEEVYEGEEAEGEMEDDENDEDDEEGISDDVQTEEQRIVTHLHSLGIVRDASEPDSSAGTTPRESVRMVALGRLQRRAQQRSESKDDSDYREVEDV